MIKQLLICSVVALGLSPPIEAMVTMSPKLARIVPKELPPLPEEYVLCFNKYWAVKEGLETELRQAWNCSQGACDKRAECCLSYKVWDSLTEVQLEECDAQARQMIGLFLPVALNHITRRCSPEFEHKSGRVPQL